MIIKELSQNEFEEFTSKYPFSSIYQTVEYSKIMQREEYSTIYVGGIEEGNIVAASLILITKIKGFSYAYAPRGFLIDYTNEKLLTNFTLEIKKFLSKKDVVAIKLCPIIIKNLFNSSGKVVGNNNMFDNVFENLKKLDYYHYGFNSYFEADKPRFEALLDLSIPYPKLFDNIKKEFKVKIRNSEIKGIKIYRADINEIGYIYSQMKNKNKKTMAFIENSFKEYNLTGKLDYYYAKLETEVYLKYIKNCFEEQDQLVSNINRSVLSKSDSSEKMLNKKIEADKKYAVLKEQLIEATNLIREYPTGLVLSTIVVVKHRNEAVVYLDTYDTEYKNFSSKHILMWKIIEKYSSLGYKRLNLGGVTDPRISNEKYDGLNKFKLNFNASILEYIGDLELVTNKPKYFLYTQLARNKK